jgi:hypothetical protein
MFRDPPCEHAMIAHRFGPCAFCLAPHAEVMRDLNARCGSRVPWSVLNAAGNPRATEAMQLMMRDLLQRERTESAPA